MDARPNLSGSHDTIFDQVLLVEDDPAHRLLIERLLRRHVKQIRSASSVGAGVTELAKGGFDCVVTDLHLPDSGARGPVPELVKVSNASVPVLVLTSASTVKDAVLAMQHGARDFLIKDFDSLAETLPLALTRIANEIELGRERARFSQLSQALTGIVEQSQDGVALVSRSGELVYANQSFRLLMGPGSRFVDLVDATTAAQLDALGERSTWSSEFQRGGVDGPPRTLAITLSRMTEPHPELSVWAVCFIRDVSSARARERFQRDLIATTTHDLRGPLGSIRLSAELLAGMPEVLGKPREISVRIQSSAQGALQLIDEFLSARRIEEGSLILRPKETQLRSLIEEVISDFSAVAQSRRLTLESNVAEQVIACVDAPALKRVIANLVGNALKFTQAGGAVRVRASQAVQQAGVERGAAGVEISVADTGAGMAPHEVARLFERFSRLERHHEVAGTGLGLFVVKSVVEAHGGRVLVASEEGRGTTFTLQLPAKPPVNERGELIHLSTEE